MTGTYKHSLDSAGRLIVPAKLRDKLGKNFYMAAGGTSEMGAVALYPMSVWEAFRQKVAALPQTEADEFDVFFAMAQECEVDKQWRFQVPDFLKEYAGLEKDVYITGNNDKALIWNAENWTQRAKQQTTPANIHALLARSRV